VEEIIQLVADTYGLKPSDILGGSRKRIIVLARREVCSLLDGMGLSLGEIGRRMKLNHTTVRYALHRRLEALGYEPPPKGEPKPPPKGKREPKPWHVFGNYTRDKAWRIYRGPRWLATQSGRKPLKAASKGELEALLAMEYAYAK